MKNVEKKQNRMKAKGKEKRDKYRASDRERMTKSNAK